MASLKVGKTSDLLLGQVKSFKVGQKEVLIAKRVGGEN
jgi:hypothetical protein